MLQRNALGRSLLARFTRVLLSSAAVTSATEAPSGRFSFVPVPKNNSKMHDLESM